MQYAPTEPDKRLALLTNLGAKLRRNTVEQIVCDIGSIVIGTDGVVMVCLWRDETGQAVGEVFAPSQAVPKARMKLTPPLPVPAERAAEIAISAAARRGLELVVADPDGLWKSYVDGASDVSAHAMDQVNQLMASDELPA